MRERHLCQQNQCCVPRIPPNSSRTKKSFTNSGDTLPNLPLCHAIKQGVPRFHRFQIYAFPRELGMVSPDFPQKTVACMKINRRIYFHRAPPLVNGKSGISHSPTQRCLFMIVGSTLDSYENTVGRNVASYDPRADLPSETSR
jgi:hypothetical protein